MWTLVVASSAVFMCLLDALVVTTALPVLKHSLRSGLPDLEWTVNAYNLSFACLLLAWSAPGLLVMPVAGKLAGRYGNRRFMVTGLLMQAAGLACVAALARPHADADCPDTDLGRTAQTWARIMDRLAS